MLPLEGARLRLIDMYVRLVMREFAASENFNPSMNDDELLYTAQQFTREGLTEGIIPEKEASGLCDVFAIELRTLTDKTLEQSPAAFEERTSTLAASLADLDTPMTGSPARTSPDADSPMTQGAGASPLFVYPASSGLALQQEWSTSFPRHLATFSTPTNNAQPPRGSGTSEEDKVEMELEVLESKSRERGKTRSPDRNRFNVRAHMIN